MAEPEITSVTGGASSMDAFHDDLLTLAHQFDAAGDTLRSMSGRVGKTMVNGDLLESSILSPLTFAEVEAAVGEAAGLLLADSVMLESFAMISEASMWAYRTVDDLQHFLTETIDYLAGFVLGRSLPFLLLGGGLLALSNPLLTAALAAGVSANKDEILEDVQAWIEANPELVQRLINGGGGLSDGLLSNLPLPLRLALAKELGIPLVNPTTNDAARGLAGLFVDGDPQVDEVTDPRVNPDAPTSVEDLMRQLAQTNANENGEIAIHTVIGPDGEPRYIVDVPGTDEWTLPGAQTDDVRDLGANLRLMGGQDTVYARGIMDAMQEAGIPPGSNVMLNGHSQGGMTAVSLAANPEFANRYSVDYVVTAGAPTAQVPDIPGNTQVLSLENSGDVVPLLDGEDNPAHDNRTTVRFDARTGSVGENHSMEQYQRGGRAVDSSDDPGLTHVRDRMREDGYLGGTTGGSQHYIISRK